MTLIMIKPEGFRWRKERKELKEQRPLRDHTNYGREVVENLELKENETFVDVGCGSGVHTIMGGQEKAKAIGIDFNEDNIKFAVKLAKLIELVFLDKEFAKNFLSLFKDRIEKKIEECKDKSLSTELSKKKEEVFSKINKELSLEEKERIKGKLLDLIPYIFGLYRLYIKLKEKDPSLEEKLKKVKLPKNVDFLQGDVVYLPLRTNSADKILCADVINWIPEENQKKVLGEILRIAKNGALIEVFPAPNLKKLAEERNIKLEKVKREKVGLRKNLGWCPIYRVIKPERE